MNRKKPQKQKPADDPNAGKFSNMFRKVWWFIWEDDSILSWVVNIILAFILVKFIIYPGLGFMLDTSHPIVAVVSGSMEHKIALSPTDPAQKLRLCDHVFKEKEHISFDEYWKYCGDWYTKNTDITKDDFRDFPFQNGFNTGDIMILYGKEPEDIKIGDVIVYQSTRPDPIIHRVVDIDKEEGQYHFQTKGDHNPGSNTDELDISEKQVIGNAVIRIPLLGWVKIWFVKALVAMGVM